MRIEDFFPGAFVVIETNPDDLSLQAMLQIEQIAAEAPQLLECEDSRGKKFNVVEAIRKLPFEALTKILYSTEAEEQDDIGWGLYHVPNLPESEQFVFAGIMGMLVKV